MLAVFFVVVFLVWCGIALVVRQALKPQQGPQWLSEYMNKEGAWDCDLDDYVD